MEKLRIPTDSATAFGGHRRHRHQRQVFCHRFLLCVVALAFTVQQSVFVSGQFLPGLDEKPNNDQDIETLEECAVSTNLVLADRTIQNQMNVIFNIRFPQLLLSSCYKSGDDEYCDVDLSDATTEFQETCINDLDGVYDAHDHTITCVDIQNPNQNGIFEIKVSNYPTCYGKECQPADIERFITRGVDILERGVETQLNMNCDSDYEIVKDEDEVGKPPLPTNTCKFRTRAIPEECGPLQVNTEEQLCDCYTFCDGKLAGCDNEEEITCPDDGNLVAGCTYELFGIYDVETGSSGSSTRVFNYPFLKLQMVPAALLMFLFCVS